MHVHLRAKSWFDFIMQLRDLELQPEHAYCFVVEVV